MTIDKRSALIYAFMKGRWQPVKANFNGSIKTIAQITFAKQQACSDYCDKMNAGVKESLGVWFPAPTARIHRHSFKYNKEMDLLLPVLKKIQGLGYSVSIEYNAINRLSDKKYYVVTIRKPNQIIGFSAHYYDMPKAVFNAVTVFVEQYNRQQK